MVPYQPPGKLATIPKTGQIVKKESNLQKVKAELTQAAKDVSGLMKKAGATTKRTARRTSKAYKQGRYGDDRTGAYKVGRFGARLYKAGKKKLQERRNRR